MKLIPKRIKNPLYCNGWNGKIGDVYGGVCPTCGEEINKIISVKKCSQCGQHLLWK